MARTNVYDDDSQFVGWFDPDRATRINETTEWSERAGQMVSVVATGGQYEHEALYLTAKGRWVLEHSSQWQKADTTYRFVDAETVRDWLLRNGSDEEIERHFGEVLTEEAGPIGRTEIGGRVTTALGDERLAQVDAQAAHYGVSRAEAIRRLLDIALTLDAEEGDGPARPETLTAARA